MIFCLSSLAEPNNCNGGIWPLNRSVGSRGILGGIGFSRCAIQGGVWLQKDRLLVRNLAQQLGEFLHQNARFLVSFFITAFPTSVRDRRIEQLLPQSLNLPLEYVRPCVFLSVCISLRVYVPFMCMSHHVYPPSCVCFTVRMSPSYICPPICMSIRVYVSSCVCPSACMSRHMYVPLCICPSVCMSLCVYLPIRHVYTPPCVYYNLCTLHPMYTLPCVHSTLCTLHLVYTLPCVCRSMCMSLHVYGAPCVYPFYAHVSFMCMSPHLYVAPCVYRSV